MTALSAALFRHAAERPEAPWLFWAEGWDWRWLSWGEAARRVEAEAATFAAADSRVAFPYRPTPASLLTDLAIQAAGRVPLPLAEGHQSPGSQGEAVPLPGAAEVIVQGSDGEWVEWSREDLMATAAVVAGAVAPAGPPAGGREILVSCRPLAAAAERAVLAWALLQGAALLLDPVPASCVATAAWARPTFFHGTAAEIAALRRLAEGAPRLLARLRRRPPGLPFGRLRIVLPLDRDLSPAEAAAWAGRGVRVAPAIFPPL